jgi:hypothetical protein
LSPSPVKVRFVLNNSGCSRADDAVGPTSQRTPPPSQRRAAAAHIARTTHTAPPRGGVNEDGCLRDASSAPGAGSGSAASCTAPIGSNDSLGAGATGDRNGRRTRRCSNDDGRPRTMVHERMGCRRHVTDDAMQMSQHIGDAMKMRRAKGRHHSYIPSRLPTQRALQLQSLRYADA